MLYRQVKEWGLLAKMSTAPVEVGQFVSVDCDELGTFARVVRFDGHPVTGLVSLKELTGEEWHQASEGRALPYEDWCDQLGR